MGSPPNFDQVTDDDQSPSSSPTFGGGANNNQSHPPPQETAEWLASMGNQHHQEGPTGAAGTGSLEGIKNRIGAPRAHHLPPSTAGVGFGTDGSHPPPPPPNWGDDVDSIGQYGDE